MQIFKVAYPQEEEEKKEEEDPTAAAFKLDYMDDVAQAKALD